MTARFRIFFDMDGVLVDFDRYCREMSGDPSIIKTCIGAYLAMPPIEGALDGIRKVMSIAGQYGGEVWLATKPPTGIPWAYADKVKWVLEHLPELKRRIILTHDKGLLGGPEDMLVDDRPRRANCEAFLGTLWHFGTDQSQTPRRPHQGASDWSWLVPKLHHFFKTGQRTPLSAMLEATDHYPEEDINAARGLLRLGHGGYPGEPKIVVTDAGREYVEGRFGGGRFGHKVGAGDGNTYVAATRPFQVRED